MCERSGDKRILMRIFVCVCKILLRAVDYQPRDESTRRRGDLGRCRAALSIMMLGDEWKPQLAGSWNNNEEAAMRSPPPPPPTKQRQVI